MSNILIATHDIIDAATLTGANVDGAYPVTNAQTDPPAEVVRASATTMQINVDLGQSTASPESYPSINIVGCLYNNAAAAATWRVRGADAEADFTSSPEAQGYDSGAVSLWTESDYDEYDRVHSLILPGGQSYRFWQIDFASITSAFQFGRLLIDAAYQPTRNAAPGLQLSVVDFSIGHDTVTGHRRVKGKQQKSMVASFPFRYEAEGFDNLLKLDQVAGNTGAVFVSLDPASRIMERSLYGTIAGSSELDHGIYNVASGGNLYSKRYQFLEIEAP